MSGVDCVLLQLLQRREFQRRHVRCLKYHTRRFACIKSFFPAGRAQTPTKARGSHGSEESWLDGGEIAALG
jgi:hypothetical protein